MKSTAEYLQDIINQKQALVDILNKKGALASINDSLENLILKIDDIGSNYFVTGRDQFSIYAKGNGKVSFMCDDIVKTVTLNPDEDTKVFFEGMNSGQDNYCFIEGINNITELDVHSCGIYKFTINEKNSINKLVIYDNHLKELDCSKFINLQFLHMHGNLLCSGPYNDDQYDYTENLIATINSLPNRIDKSMGSIIFYPWMGLETLIEEVDGKYYKYPYKPDLIGNQYHPNNPNNPNKSFDLVEGKIYGRVRLATEEEISYDKHLLWKEIIQGTTKYYDIKYCTYDSGFLAENNQLNYYHKIRKYLEHDICLPKNWVFGSAIQYHDDYNYCHYYFRQSGIQDIWETAEKGFGICIGTIDGIAGHLPNWNNMNIKSYLMHGAENPGIIYNENHPNYERFVDGEVSHGEVIMGQIIGRGKEEGCYGICPNAQYFAIDSTYPEGHVGPEGQQRFLSDIKVISLECNSLTLSTYFHNRDDSNTFLQIRDAIGIFGENNIVTQAAGNEGCGIPYDCRWSGKSHLHGNYGNNNSKKTTTFFVQSVGPEKMPSMFTSIGMDTFNEKLANYSDEDFLSCYGEQILSYRNTPSIARRVCAQGTSMASPNCNAILALMRIVYSKINQDCTSFGKFSSFMDYVKMNWINRIENQMDFATGLGIPCFFVDKNISYNKLKKPAGAIAEYSNCVNQEINIVDVIPKDCKQAYYLDYDYAYFSKLSNGNLVPIRAPSTKDVLEKISLSGGLKCKIGYAVDETTILYFNGKYDNKGLCISDNIKEAADVFFSHTYFYNNFSSVNSFILSFVDNNVEKFININKPSSNFVTMSLDEDYLTSYVYDNEMLIANFWSGKNTISSYYLSYDKYSNRIVPVSIPKLTDEDKSVFPISLYKIKNNSKIELFTNCSTDTQLKSKNYYTTDIYVGEIKNVSIETPVSGNDLNLKSGKAFYDYGTKENFPNCINTTTSSSNYTIQFLIKFTAETLFDDILSEGIEGIVTKSSINLLAWNNSLYDSQKLKILRLSAELSSAGKHTFIPQEYSNSYDLTTDYIFNPPASTDLSSAGQTIFYLSSAPTSPRISAYLGSQAKLKIKENDLAVITMTVKENQIAFYYNGNKMNLIENAETHPSLSDIYINSIVLPNNSTDDVLMYNRVLTEEEIIYNTIYLIQREELIKEVNK